MQRSFLCCDIKHKGDVADPKQYSFCASFVKWVFYPDFPVERA